MLIAYSLDELQGLVEPGSRHAATIGNFDGVHAGHRELIRVAREKAAARGVSSALITFNPHPVRIVRGIDVLDTITPLPRKLELLSQTGVDVVAALPFTHATAAMSAEAFVRETLVEGLRATDLVTGFNFALGRDREGDFSVLGALGEKWGFAVSQVPPVVVNKETVSSSLIRERIRSGDVDKAAKLLARPHSVDGVVVRGEGRGRSFGFPTANIRFADTLLPALGAYATWLQILGDDGPESLLPSMTSVGTNPTFGENALTLEANVLDFSGDLYGKTVRLHFAARLRGQVRFKSPQELVGRLALDAAHAKTELEKNPWRGKDPHNLN